MLSYWKLPEPQSRNDKLVEVLQYLRKVKCKFKIEAQRADF